MSDHKQFLCSHLVTLRCGGRQTSANMEKIWARGAEFNAEEAVEPGAPLDVSSPEWQVSGTVTQCRREEDGYFIDIEFEDGYEWDRSRFEPGHLTDLDVLLVRKLLSELSPR